MSESALAIMSRVVCPAEVRRQVADFVDATREMSTGELVGIYLHGSLAMGCFNPSSSDVDLLVVNSSPMSLARKTATAISLLAHSMTPAPIEVSYLVESDLRRWEHPPTYDLHYSEAWRARFEQDLSIGLWSSLSDPADNRRDPDLAAHITVTRSRGVCLTGQPIEAVFPDVPTDDFLSSVLADLDWSLQPGRFARDPGYAILNHCRVYRYLVDGSVCSKAEAAGWAREVVPCLLLETIDGALLAYRSTVAAPPAPPPGAFETVLHLRDRIALELVRLGQEGWEASWPDGAV